MTLTVNLALCRACLDLAENMRPTVRSRYYKMLYAKLDDAWSNVPQSQVRRTVRMALSKGNQMGLGREELRIQISLPGKDQPDLQRFAVEPNDDIVFNINSGIVLVLVVAILTEWYLIIAMVKSMYLSTQRTVQQCY